MERRRKSSHSPETRPDGACAEWELQRDASKWTLGETAHSGIPFTVRQPEGSLPKCIREVEIVNEMA